MGLRVLNAAGKEVTPIMGSYGIGIERILCAAIELYHDKDGMALPASIAPFEVVVTPVNSSDEAQGKAAANDIYDACLAAGLDALLDDRDERPGVKFKDADLIGIPLPRHRGQEARAGTSRDRRTPHARGHGCSRRGGLRLRCWQDPRGARRWPLIGRAYGSNSRRWIDGPF